MRTVAWGLSGRKKRRRPLWPGYVSQQRRGGTTPSIIASLPSSLPVLAYFHFQTFENAPIDFVSPLSVVVEQT